MSARSPFLQGSFAPVTGEITAFDLPVTGRVPVELTGRYLRNGPNPLDLDDPAYHWFLGTGMVHGVRLRDGRAQWYRNRWVRSQTVAAGLGEKWPAGPVHAGFDFGANTHLIAHGGRLLATVEAGPLPYELSDELDTVGPCDFDGGLPGGFAAHTRVDPRTGELHAIAYFWAWDHIAHIVIDAAGKVRRSTDIAVPDGPMMHDFALTEKYVILLDLPVTFSMDAVAAGLQMPYAWNPAHQARVGLLRRDGGSGDGGTGAGGPGGAGDVRWFEVDPCWVFHILNSYDDGDQAIVDLCCYERGFDVATMSGPGPLTLERWIIDTVGGTVTRWRLDDRRQEFPRVDQRVISRPYRYGYTVVTEEVNRATLGVNGDFADDAFANALLKHDLARGTVEAHEFGRAATVGEAVFAPVSADAAEDDGYVMAFLHNPDRGAADLVILASQDFTGEPVARIHLPARIPLGFHGSWIADH